jgi:hypothetical protein
MGQQAAQ